MNDRSDGEYSTALTEAANWLARLRGPSGPDLADEHAAWLARSPRNRQAFDQVSRAFSGSAVLRASPRFSLQGRRRAQRRRRAIIATGAMAASAMLVAGLWTWVPDSSGIAQRDAGEVTALALSTGPGEIRRFALPDGSWAILDTNSKIEVEPRPDGNRVRLIAGRVRLSVTDRRPWSIETGGTRVGTGGGSFDFARFDTKRLLVSVLSGSALVEPREGLKGIASFRLGKGQWLQVGPGNAALAPSTGVRGDAEWTTGWVAYNSIPLGDLVAAANRYATTPIVIDDPALRARRMSGRFHIADPAGFAERTALLFDLAVVTTGDAIHLRTRENIRDPN